MVLCVWQFGELSVPFFFNTSKHVYPYAGVRVSVHVVCEFVAASFCLCACAGIYLHVGLSMWLCDGVCMYLLLLVWVCVWVYMCVCVLVVWGGVSLVSLLNIKQLEVIKYLGSAGSLWILILPFPSVSQISLSFPFFLCLFFSLPVSPPAPLPILTWSLYLYLYVVIVILSPLASVVHTHAWSLPPSLFPVHLTVFMKESQSLNWGSTLPAGTQCDGGGWEELTYTILSCYAPRGDEQCHKSFEPAGNRVYHTASCHVKHTSGPTDRQASEQVGPFGLTRSYLDNRIIFFSRMKKREREN